MRLPLSLAAIAVSFGAAPALAANGCPSGGFSKVTSPDGNATSFLFDDFSASAGGGSGVTRASSTCRLSVDVTRPDGHTVYGVDYRGFVATGDGQVASLTATQDGKTVLDHQITGPLEDDTTARSIVGVSGAGSLDLTVVATAAGPLDEDAFEAGIFMDTIDFARLGFTTTASVRASLDEIAGQRQTLMLDLMDTAHGLLGQQRRFDEGSFFSLLGNSDAAIGFNGRWEAGNGISLHGGAAYVDTSRSDVLDDALVLGAAALRYTTPEATWRAFGEAGVWGSPDVSARLSRRYLNIDDLVLAGGVANGSLFNAYARAGVIYAPDDANEIALSLRATRSFIDLDGYRETTADKNLFAATVRGGTSTADTVAAEVAWSHDGGGRLDYTLSGAIGRTFAASKGARASVDWVGDVAGKADDQTFGTLGGRVGIKLDERFRLDTTLSVTARQGEAARWSIGGQLGASF
ncbi:DUF4360 domain-containing protein [Ensifer soli]|uniref:DUF4360 domain-containing protein n=1 Tax=Ciceribacter sp. sgz301302 TaxID=3342379 RepID=UPI0035BB57CE